MSYQQYVLRCLLPIAVIFGVLTPGIVSCSKHETPQKTDEELAADAALKSYTALYGGQTKMFLDQRIHADSLSDEYRRQLLDCYRRHLSLVNSRHQGVSRVEVSRAEKAADLGIMQVFLVLSFGDGTCEEVVVPMVERGGQWMLK